MSNIFELVHNLYNQSGCDSYIHGQSYTELIEEYKNIYTQRNIYN